MSDRDFWAEAVKLIQRFAAVLYKWKVEGK
jgi:hypothetical protein